LAAEETGTPALTEGRGSEGLTVDEPQAPTSNELTASAATVRSRGVRDR
jgi:hypothetical protein